MDQEFSNDILIDANRLRKNNIQKRQIRECILELLKRINDELKNAHSEGRHNLITELPIIYQITNMSETDARREIWCTIIQTLKKKHYRIVIDPQKDTCVLQITWYSKEDESEIAYQSEIINDHRKKS